MDPGRTLVMNFAFSVITISSMIPLVRPLWQTVEDCRVWLLKGLYHSQTQREIRSNLVYNSIKPHHNDSLLVCYHPTIFVSALDLEMSGVKELSDRGDFTDSTL